MTSFSSLEGGRVNHIRMPFRVQTIVKSEWITPAVFDADWVGAPYGSRARLILLFLQSEALLRGS